jgi:hypothetical protein
MNPFNRYYSFEDVARATLPAGHHGAGGLHHRRTVVVLGAGLPVRQSRRLVRGDTARFHPYEAFHGQRFRIGAQYSPAILATTVLVTDYRIDYRKWLVPTRRSSVACGCSARLDAHEIVPAHPSAGASTRFGATTSTPSRGPIFSNFELRFPSSTG